MTTGYRPYTTGAQRFPRPGQGYAPGGVTYLGSPAPRPVPRYTASRSLARLTAPVGYPSYYARGYPGSSGDRPGTLGPGVAPYTGSSGGYGDVPDVSDTTPPANYVPPGGAPPADTGGDAYLNDPVYQQIAAMANANVAQAQAQADAARKQVALELGDPGLATSLGLGSLVAQTAAANPNSTLKNLLRAHNQASQQLDSQLNRSNLFSSSTRTRQQQLEGTGYLANIAGAGATAQRNLGQILSVLLGAQQTAAGQKQSAAADAYRAWIASGAGATDPTDPTTTTTTPYTQADAYAALLAASMAGTNPKAPGGV